MTDEREAVDAVVEEVERIDHNILTHGSQYAHWIKLIREAALDAYRAGYEAGKMYVQQEITGSGNVTIVQREARKEGEA